MDLVNEIAWTCQSCVPFRKYLIRQRTQSGGSSNLDGVNHAILASLRDSRVQHISL